MVKVRFLKSHQKRHDGLVIPLFDNKKFPSSNGLDKEFKFLKDILKKESSFKAKIGDVLKIALPGSSDFKTAFILGLGSQKECDGLMAEKAGGKLFPNLKSAAVKNVALLPVAKHTEHILNGIILRSYSFTHYKTNKEKKKSTLESLDVCGTDLKDVQKAYAALHSITEGVFWARDLVNEPPNVLYPESYAKRIKEELKPLGVQVEIFDDKKMDKLGMGAALAVGKGSEKKPCMVVMRWNGLAKKARPIAFVGKGVTFDTGGISLKPGAAMDEMKMDMGGSAAVVGLMKALALRKAKSNVVAMVGLAENMPSSNAYRPADILTSYAGKTIEVLNTDAEGRLVLVDCLSYIQKTYKPKFVINLATLTGAMMVALGHEHCGTFVNDNTLWSQMEKASKVSGEKLWRMPLDEFWRKDVESDIADVRNLGKSGRYGGACSAASFLEHFIEKDMSWAHMDIAGTAWRKSEQPTVPKYGTGFGVRVLNQLVADHYEG